MSAAPRADKAGLWTVVTAVLWGFLGVRRRSDYEQDITRLKPLQLMAVGVAMALLFVLGLMLLVHWVVPG